MTTERVQNRNKDRSIISFTRSNTVASLLTFISANRAVFFSVYAWKGRFSEAANGEVAFAVKEAPPAIQRSWRRSVLDRHGLPERGYLPCFGRLARSRVRCKLLFPRGAPLWRPAGRPQGDCAD